MFAGPNGAGKSTLVDRYVRERIPVVNPDNIALTLPGSLSPAARMLLAGRLALKKRAELLDARTSFGIETTLTGKSETGLMAAANAVGYKINLVYIGLREVSHSIGRVQERAARGGHDVPIGDLLRRFDRSLANLSDAAVIADRFILIDNSGLRLRLILISESSTERLPTGSLPNWANLALGRSANNR